MEISNNSGFTSSLWMEVQLPSFPQLDSDIETDVCIVGGGIAGLSCAYTLAKEGKSVIVVDQGSIGGGQTARTTAHLTWVLDERYYNLEKLFGEEGARDAANSHSSAIDYIEKIVFDEKIDCDFERVDGYLFIGNDSDVGVLDKEFAAIQKMQKEVVKESKDSFIGPSLRFPKQAQFHILKYLQGLIKAILKYNGKIFSHTHVSDFKDGSSCITTTEGGAKILSKDIIVATCTPVNNRFFIHSKQAAYRTYVIAASIPKSSVLKGLYWDTCDPYHYIRIQKHLSDPNLEWLIIGGEDHRTGQDGHVETKYDDLENWARMHFPMMGRIGYRWSGQVFEPVDSLGFIGKNPGDNHTYITTGDSGNGMTNGTIAGILISDLILGKSNPWKDLYDPSRKTLTAAKEFIEENLNTFFQYRDWFTPCEIKKIDELSPGDGVILREGLKKIAVYKDHQNTPYINSAFCPHLGGCVRWNTGEKSWDCPCHGSRFDGYGKVITGPSIEDLCPFEQQ